MRSIAMTSVNREMKFKVSVLECTTHANAENRKRANWFSQTKVIKRHVYNYYFTGNYILIPANKNFLKIFICVSFFLSSLFTFLLIINAIHI